jgi:hypothetical protein
MSALRDLFAKLFAPRRTIIITESRVTINGRDATPEEAADVMRTLDHVGLSLDEAGNAIGRAFLHTAETLNDPKEP